MSRKRYLNNQILLSVVALLAVFVLGVSITFSWIEGGTTYSLQTENSGDVKTESELDNVDYNNTVYLNPRALSTLDLFEYDNTTNEHQTVFFSPVSSKDGENFYFPINLDGYTTAYRESTTNDIGTKFISFDFDVKASFKCYLAFNKAPEISVTKSGVTVTDTSAFRIMISDGTAGGTHIFSTGGVISNTVVDSISGTTPTMTALTTEAFTDYITEDTKTNKLYAYDKNETGNIKVSIWLDESAASNILGGDVTISMSLAVVAEDINATFDAVTYDRSGNKLSNGFTGGSIKYGSTTHTSSFEVASTTFTATAVPNDGYEFVGWYKDAACTDEVGTAESLVQTPEEDVSYYAKFQECTKTTIYIEKRTDYSTYSVWAYNGSTNYSDSDGNGWPGDSATYDSDTGYYKYEFTTTDTGDFYVIISDNGSDQYPGVDEDGLKGTLGGTYLFRANNTLVEFDPDDMITFKVSASTGGSAYVNGYSSVKILSGDSVKLTASASNGYKFTGWYKDSTYSTTIGSSYATASQTVTVTGTAGSTITYYAKFDAITYITAKTSVTPTGGGTATVNGYTSVSVAENSTVNLVATPADGYEFAGWYTNSACTTTIGTNYLSESTTYTLGSSAITFYAKFEESAYTINVGVIYYLKDNDTVNQVYYWCDDGSNGTINLSDSYTARSYSVGSSYWSGSAQSFYCYEIEVPDNVSGIKFKNSSNSWFGSDVTNFVDGKIDLIFEFDGNYINYRATY